MAVKLAIKSMGATTDFLPKASDPIFQKTKVSRGLGTGFGMASNIIKEFLPKPLSTVFSIFSTISSGTQAATSLAVADQTLRLVCYGTAAARRRRETKRTTEPRYSRRASLLN